MGLLQRCSDILERYNKMFVSFQNSKNTIPFSFQQLHRILNKFGVLHLGLYVPIDKHYTMFFNHGFDAKTRSQGNSSADFWFGTLSSVQPELSAQKPEENTWYTQENQQLDSFLQLFSLEDREHIALLHIKFLTFNNIRNCIILVSQENKNQTETDTLLDFIDENFSDLLPHIENILKFHLYTLKPNIINQNPCDLIQENYNAELSGTMIDISFSPLIQSLRDSNPNPDIVQIILILSRLIKDHLPENSLCVEHDSENLKLILFSQNGVFVEKFAKDMMNYLSDYFSNGEEKRIVFSTEGTTMEPDELLKFLQLKDTEPQF